MKRNAFALLAAVSVANCASAAVLATDPTGQSDGINPLAETMDEELGGTSLTAFNSISDKVTFTFETTDNYGALGFANTTNQDVVLSAGNAVFGSGLTTTFDGPDKFSNFEGYGLDAVTSGTRAMSNNDNGTFVITFSDGVGGVGFTLNRLVQASTAVRLYDATGGGNQITSANFAANSTLNGHSFFGYVGNADNIRRVELDLGGGFIGIDDFTVTTAIPEPSALCFTLFGTVGLFLRRRR